MCATFWKRCAVSKIRRPKATFKELLPERFDWGRLFGEIRIRNQSNAKRLALIAAGPLIPPLLEADILRETVPSPPVKDEEGAPGEADYPQSD